MDHRRSWEANSHSANQEFPRLLWNPRLITVLASPRPCVTFHNMLFYYSEELVAPAKPRSWRITPLWSIRDWLIDWLIDWSIYSQLPPMCGDRLLHPQISWEIQEETWEASDQIQRGGRAVPQILFTHYVRGSCGSFCYACGNNTGGKDAGAWSWPLTSIQFRDWECVELYLHSPSVVMAWWLVKHRDKFSGA
jgi:hypothetical protein